MILKSIFPSNLGILNYPQGHSQLVMVPSLYVYNILYILDTLLNQVMNMASLYLSLSVTNIFTTFDSWHVFSYGLISYPQDPCEVAVVAISMLRMRKLRFKEVKEVAGQGLNPRSKRSKSDYHCPHYTDLKPLREGYLLPFFYFCTAHHQVVDYVS